MKFKNLLQQANYTLIFPMENVLPLSLILKDEGNVFSLFRKNTGSLLNAGIGDLFIKSGRGGKYPEISEHSLPENILGSDFVDSNTSFVTNFIAKARIKGGTSANRSRKMLFNFKNAMELSVNLVMLDEYLSSSRLTDSSYTFTDAIKKNNVYVITSSLVSNELELKNADDFNFDGELNVDLVKNYMDASVVSSFSGEERYLISSKGNVALTFAIKAVRILSDNDKYRIKPEKINVRGDIYFKQLESTFLNEASEELTLL